MNEAWMVTYYNSVDAEFGYDPGTQLVAGNLTKAVAKAIARFKNRTTPDFIWYSAEPEPERWA